MVEALSSEQTAVVNEMRYENASPVRWSALAIQMHNDGSKL